jgi:hypothetical protein
VGGEFVGEDASQISATFEWRRSRHREGIVPGTLDDSPDEDEDGEGE